MKKIRTDFEPQFWAVGKRHSAVKLMESFFQCNELTISKERLGNIMHYAVKRDRWIREEPSVILHFNHSMRAFVRACYLMTLKNRKWSVDTRLEEISPWVLGLLSEKEYRNPSLVFRKAFKEYTVKEFDYFMSGMVYFSLGIYDHLPERNIVMPYIHLIKMLDAGHLMLERRGKKTN